jgi:predicted transposase/invertase (TIGR01784 family)
VHHDALFKAAFEHPAHAAGLFRHVLPPALAHAIDWSTLALEPGSYVDEALAQSHGDLLFSAQVGDHKALLYVLLEHQSRSDPRMPYRALRYVMRIWDRHFDKQVEPLPLILALVISHAPGGWTAPVHLHELIAPSPASLEGVAPFVPSFKILVDDLAHLSNELIEQRALETFPELVLRVLRDARDSDRLDLDIGRLAQLASKLLAAPSGIAAVSQVLHYIAQVCEGLHYDDFCAKLREHLPEAERPIMTAAEELMQKGRAQGQVTMLVRQLTRKFGDLPAEYRARLEAATTELLEHYADRVLIAPSLAAVFAED